MRRPRTGRGLRRRRCRRLKTRSSRALSLRSASCRRRAGIAEVRHPAALGRIAVLEAAGPFFPVHHPPPAGQGGIAPGLALQVVSILPDISHQDRIASLPPPSLLLPRSVEPPLTRPV